LIYKKEKKHDLELQTLREAHNLAPNNKTIKEHYDDAKERSKK